MGEERQVERCLLARPCLESRREYRRYPQDAKWRIRHRGRPRNSATQWAQSQVVRCTWSSLYAPPGLCGSLDNRWTPPPSLLRKHARGSLAGNLLLLPSPECSIYTDRHIFLFRTTPWNSSHSPRTPLKFSSRTACEKEQTFMLCNEQ